MCVSPVPVLCSDSQYHLTAGQDSLDAPLQHQRAPCRGHAQYRLPSQGIRKPPFLKAARQNAVLFFVGVLLIPKRLRLRQ